MQASMPILAATDVNTDIGQVIESGEFGFWSKSDNEEKFNEKIQKLCDIDLIDKMGKNARKYLEKYYVVKESYDIIMKHYI
jgi:glycosyltransferase involved in cell wall biosynthesis